MVANRRQFTLSGILACTTFIAVAACVSLQFGRGIFVPSLLALATALGIARSRTKANRIHLAKFLIGVCVYLMYVPALNAYFDHLVWRVFQPVGRFGGATYDLIEVGTLLFPIVFHAIAAGLNGWFAANATRLLLSVWLAVSAFWVLYPVLLIQNVWVDPLFDLHDLPWPSSALGFVGLTTAAYSLCVLYLLSPAENVGRVQRLAACSTTCILAYLLTTVLVGL